MRDHIIQQFSGRVTKLIRQRVGVVFFDAFSSSIIFTIHHSHHDKAQPILTIPPFMLTLCCFQFPSIVLATAYVDYASSRQKAALLSEFYGPQFTAFNVRIPFSTVTQAAQHTAARQCKCGDSGGAHVWLLWFSNRSTDGARWRSLSSRSRGIRKSVCFGA